MVLLKMMLLNLAGPLHELSFNKSHCIQLENKVMTRGMYICEYVSLFRLLAVCNIYIYIYIYTYTRARTRANSCCSFFWFIGFWHISQKSTGDGRAPVKSTLSPDS